MCVLCSVDCIEKETVFKVSCKENRWIDGVCKDVCGFHEFSHSYKI